MGEVSMLEPQQRVTVPGELVLYGYTDERLVRSLRLATRW